MATIRRIDPARHMARFYAVALQADLFGSWGLVREWGRIGRPGRVRVDPCADLDAAEAASRRLERSNRRRGYG